FKDRAGPVSGLAAGPDGRLYASQPARQRILSYTAGGEEKVFAQGIMAYSLAVSAKGVVYYSDPGNKAFGYVDQKGLKRLAYHGGEIVAPAAIALSPDQAMLMVTDSRSRFSWSFQI